MCANTTSAQAANTQKKETAGLSYFFFFFFNLCVLCLNQLAAARRSHQKAAGGGAHFLISLPPHWLTRRDGCFFSHTCSLSRSLFIQQTVLFSLQFPGCFFHLFSNFPSPSLCFRLGFFLLSFCLLKRLSYADPETRRLLLLFAPCLHPPPGFFFFFILFILSVSSQISPRSHIL